MKILNMFLTHVCKLTPKLLLNIKIAKCIQRHLKEHQMKDTSCEYNKKCTFRVNIQCVYTISSL